MKTLININVFENRKAQEFFLECSNSLEGKKKEAFSLFIINKFDMKITSKEGVCKEFKITKEDVAETYDFVAGNTVSA
jgi:hypothetical protein